MTPASAWSVAGERIPHGAPVRIAGEACLLEPDLASMDGVAKRPHQTHATHHEPSEPVEIQTDGGIMAEIDREPTWVELRNGRIIND